MAPQVAVLTNIRLEHTATFGKLEDIAEGESEIFSSLKKGGVAVLPREDPFFELLKKKIPRDRDIRIKSFGFSQDASVHARDLSSWPGPTKFTVVHQDEKGNVIDQIRCTLPALGRFNVLNACASAAACLSLRVPVEKIKEGLENFKPPSMRFEVVSLEDGIVIVNDSYNANPGSMKSALEGFVESFPNRRLCVVLSDMLELGEISRLEHQALGMFLAGFPLSKVILYGPQSRFTWEGAKSSFLDEKTLCYCPDRDSLLKKIRSALEPGTAVLFKGSRGMHLEEIIQEFTEKTSLSKK